MDKVHENDELDFLRNALYDRFDKDFVDSCELGELQQLYDEIEAEDKLEEFLPDELNSFVENSLTTKEQLLNSIHRCRNEYAQQASYEKTAHSQGFYKTLDRLLNEFYSKVVRTTLPEPLPDWWSYSYVITASGIQLYLDHYRWSYSSRNYDCHRDENLVLLDVPAKRLTVSKFAEIYSIEEVTVRQWIRRGKIRSASKLGKEWRIPELAEVSKNRGYSPCRYQWKEELTDLPDKYSFLNQFESALFAQDDDNADLYVIALDVRTTESDRYMALDEKITNRCAILRQYPALTLNNEGEIVLTRKEREDLELYMIANPLVYCKSKEHEHHYNEHIDEYGNEYCPGLMFVTISEM